jgi:transposase
MATSVLDAGWSTLKTMLEYKCARAKIVFEEVNEAYTTETCFCCGSRQNSPKGRAGIGIREWSCECSECDDCGECGVTDDRYINAANNILAVGLDRLAEKKVAA